MREIKFRVWDTLNKEYEDPSDVHIDLETGELYEVVPVPLKSILSAGLKSIYNQNRYILEQFTGLKDKNGVEIYDGDILQYDNEIKIKGIVKWIDDEALFSIHYESGKYGLFAGEDMSLFEIIGNVHEEVFYND
jgi:uncharacterized phage protein (TIGR01671 family)